MQADFSRVTFDPASHFSAVLAQQGRVQLDADVNEQAAILLRQLRLAVADIVGPAGAPEAVPGFKISLVNGKSPTEDLAISAGRMYVDGVLVENDEATTYWAQPDGYLDPDGDALPGSAFLVYLRVWERLITAVQDPSIREIALGDRGPDTCARARTVWQVAATADPATAEGFDNWLAGLRTTGKLRADAKRPSNVAGDPCHLPPQSQFRGLENQLYRVEVHTGGLAWQLMNLDARRHQSAGRAVPGATFKWSRENASVVFPILSVSGAVVRLAALGRDRKLDLEVGDWVEIVDDASASRVADDIQLADPHTMAPRLRQVREIDDADHLITLDEHPDDDCDLGPNPFLRRWDHGSASVGSAPVEVAGDGALPIVENQWIDIEDGVQVYFQRPAGEQPGTYRRGDYWLIPARVETGDVIWPQDQEGPIAKPPDGVQYYYAPLATVANGQVDASLRRTFTPLATAAASKSTLAQSAEQPIPQPAKAPQKRASPSTRRRSTGD